VTAGCIGARQFPEPKGETTTNDEARENAREESKTAEDQKPKQPKPHTESDDAFGFIPGDFIPGGGL
jgi:hypothetical protein